MKRNEHFIELYDKNGTFHSIQLSAEAWEKGGKPLASLVESLFADEALSGAAEPVAEWEKFQQYWDFEYPICSDVECKTCGVKVDNWQTAPDHPFTLKSAQLGGLVVFICKGCGSIVRKKHFKDHICFEASPKCCG